MLPVILTQLPEAVQISSSQQTDPSWGERSRPFRVYAQEYQVVSILFQLGLELGVQKAS